MENKNNKTQLEAMAARGMEAFQGVLNFKASPPESGTNDRRISCAAYTGSVVDRVDFWTGERYKLRLSLEPGACDLSRVAAKACPVLDDHMNYEGSESIIGIVESAVQTTDALNADLRFSMDPEVDSVWNKIQEGIIASVSVGVVIPPGSLFRENAEDEKPAQYVAKNWQLMEISPTGMPADMNAGFLSAQLGRDTIKLNNQLADSKQRPETEEGSTARITKGEPMDEQTMNTAGQQQAPPAPAVTAAQVLNIQDAQKLAVEQERNRVTAITEIAKKYNLGIEFSEKAIKESWSREKAVEEALNVLASREENRGIERTQRAEVSVDSRDKLRVGIEAAIELRANPQAPAEVQKMGRDFAGRRLLEMARVCVEVAGVSTLGWSNDMVASVALNPRHEKFGGMMSTSDLPNILANVANKSLRQAYQAAPKTFQPFCRQASAPDFKTVNRVQLSDVDSLKTVNEHGEFKRIYVSDSKEQYSLATWGGIVPITRKVVINDDLQALTRIPAGLGIAAANIESDTVWGVITANANMSDSVALFHATHGNLKSSNALAAVANITAARVLMRKQTGPKGTILNLIPRFLIVPAALEGIAVQLTNPVNLAATASSSDVPQFVRTMIPIVEPRLDAVASVGATDWYTAADPNQIDTIEYCYLEGENGVYTEMRTGFDVDGVEIKARLDFAAKALDWRGLQKNQA